MRRTHQKSIGFFLVALVLMLPFYSASALAATVSVTQNQGGAQVPNFIDGKGDEWSVQATVTGSEDVAPSDVLLEIGDASNEFTNCAQETFGTVCTYSSSITGIDDGSYDFKVRYTQFDENGAVLETAESSTHKIHIDASAPKIAFSQGNVAQSEDGEVSISFSVKDMPDSGKAVGLGLIEVLDANSNSVLLTLEEEVMGKESYEHGGVLSVANTAFQGEGVQYVKVRATDLLGHSSTSNAISFSADFSDPLILKGSLTLTGLEEFIGSVDITTDMSVEIKETSLPSVSATSQQLGIEDKVGVCDIKQGELDVWICTWTGLSASPEASILVEFSATDMFGNSAQASLSKTLSKDTSAPSVEFFGTKREHDGKMYVASGENRIILQVSESGAGIVKENVLANLLEVDGGANAVPDMCEHDENSNEYVCSWDVTSSFPSSSLISTARISLKNLKDSAGNLGANKDVDLLIDTLAPIVKGAELISVGGSEKDFFATGDQIKVVLRVEESEGVHILANLNNIIPDAALSLPARTEHGVQVEEGWKMFDGGDHCARAEDGLLDCTIITDPIEVGNKNVGFDVEVLDIAGNNAKVWDSEPENVVSGGSGEYTLEVLGVEDDANADLWYVNSQNIHQVGFVDLDVVELAPARVPIQVRVESKDAQARVGFAEIVGCAPTSAAPQVVLEEPTQEGEGVEELDALSESELPSAPLQAPALSDISSPILIGGNPSVDAAYADMMLVMQLEPFNGKEMFGIHSDAGEDVFEEAIASYTCQLRIYTIRGNNALMQPELEEVEIDVAFAFSKLGALDENLEGRVKAIKNEVFFTIADTLSVLNTVLEWLQWGFRIFNILNSVDGILNLYNANAEAYRSIPLAGTAVAAGICSATGSTQLTLTKFIRGAQEYTSILSCGSQGLGGAWRGEVLDTYNTYTGRSALGVPATSPYENIILSSAALCAPGIIHNIEKYRQVRCREMLCYQNDVANGVASVDSCKNLGNYLTCRYVTGQILDFVPIFNVWDTYVNWVKQWYVPFAQVTSGDGKATVAGLITLVHTGLQVPCLVSCIASNTVSASCRWTGTIVNVINIISSIKGAFDSWPAQVADPYCSQVEGLE